MAFNDQLKQARLKAGLTQQQVADRMGITNSTYCGYETGKRKPNLIKLKQLASILGVSGDRMLETGFDDPPVDEVRAQAHALIDSMSSSELEAFLLFASGIKRAGDKSES